MPTTFDPAVYRDLLHRSYAASQWGDKEEAARLEEQVAEMIGSLPDHTGY